MPTSRNAGERWDFWTAKYDGSLYRSNEQRERPMNEQVLTQEVIDTLTASLDMMAHEYEMYGRSHMDMAAIDTARDAIAAITAAPALPAGSEGLLPCPFCGVVPEIETYMDESLWSHNIVEHYQISCRVCDIVFFVSEVPGRAKEQWNRRAALPQPAPDDNGGRWDK